MLQCVDPHAMQFCLPSDTKPQGKLLPENYLSKFQVDFAPSTILAEIITKEFPETIDFCNIFEHF